MEQQIIKTYDRLNSLNVSRETFLDFEIFISMMLEKNKEINIISQETAKDENVRERHIIDSAQIIDFINFNKNIVTDLGSGGGMPGIVIAIILKNMKKNILEYYHNKFKSPLPIPTQFPSLSCQFDFPPYWRISLITSTMLSFLDSYAQSRGV